MEMLLTHFRYGEGIVTYDDRHHELISRYKWGIQAAYDANRYYVIGSGIINGQFRSVSMHRLIMGFPEGKIVHHIDGNGCNNYLSNLKIMSAYDHIRFHNSSHVKKIKPLKNGGRKYPWAGYFLMQNRNLETWKVKVGYRIIGTYATEVEAKRVWEICRMENPEVDEINNQCHCKEERKTIDTGSCFIKHQEEENAKHRKIETFAKIEYAHPRT